jgi:hypothetical protein
VALGFSTTSESPLLALPGVALHEAVLVQLSETDTRAVAAKDLALCREIGTGGQVKGVEPTRYEDESPGMRSACSVPACLAPRTTASSSRNVRGASSD